MYRLEQRWKVGLPSISRKCRFRQKKSIFSAEAHFDLGWYVNKQKKKYLADPIHEWRDLQFKGDFKRQFFFEKLFLGKFIYSQSFWQKSAERNSPKNNFLHILFCWIYLIWGLNQDFTSNKPIIQIFQCIQFNQAVLLTDRALLEVNFRIASNYLDNLVRLVKGNIMPDRVGVHDNEKTRISCQERPSKCPW